jgi:hypothetical protein
MLKGTFIESFRVLTKITKKINAFFVRCYKDVKGEFQTIFSILDFVVRIIINDEQALNCC